MLKLIMILLFCWFILTGALIFLMSAGSRAVVWRTIRFGTQRDSSKIRVFIDTDSIQVFGVKVRFWHWLVFYEEQSLPSGKSFIRIPISRVVDCDSMSDSNLEAVFYGPAGDIIDIYGT